MEACRSPCGERGLKFCISKESARKFMRSLPVRGAWVEISTPTRWSGFMRVAPRAGSVG